jgi:hypothetical protein
VEQLPTLLELVEPAMVRLGLFQHLMAQILGLRFQGALVEVELQEVLLLVAVVVVVLVVLMEMVCMVEMVVLPLPVLVGLAMLVVVDLGALASVVLEQMELTTPLQILGTVRLIQIQHLLGVLEEAVPVALVQVTLAGLVVIMVVVAVVVVKTQPVTLLALLVKAV